jgi:cytochrome c-type biogenesis protein CcmH/NrfG
MENYDTDTQREILATARELFKENKYNQTEPLLNQLILKGSKSPEIFQMLGTIYYDRGKFNKAIKAFRRALEIEPTFTDASVGLSIILNDLGKYEEGRKVFEDAQSALRRTSRDQDPFLNEKFSIKHDELGEMYLQHSRFDEAVEQFYRALALSSRKPELSMKVINTYFKMNDDHKGLLELKKLVKEYPGYISARVQLGRVLFEQGDVASAVEQWEAVLLKDPDNQEASRLLRQSQTLMDSQL